MVSSQILACRKKIFFPSLSVSKYFNVFVLGWIFVVHGFLKVTTYFGISCFRYDLLPSNLFFGFGVGFAY